MPRPRWGVRRGKGLIAGGASAEFRPQPTTPRGSSSGSPTTSPRPVHGSTVARSHASHRLARALPCCSAPHALERAVRAGGGEPDGEAGAPRRARRAGQPTPARAGPQRHS